jgi:hypothetical protein
VGIVLALAVAQYFQSQLKTITAAPKSHILVPAPAAAGGLVRDYTAERTTTYRAAMAQATSQFKHQDAGVATSFAVAVYDQPGHVDPATKGPVRVTYIGLNMASSAGNPSTGLSTFMAGVTAGVAGRAVLGRPVPVPAGPGGGSAECVVETTLVAQAEICSWATDWTVGTVVVPVRDASMSEVAAMMRRLRPALEHG